MEFMDILEASALKRKRAELCIEACAGIDTAHLWPGAMGEMVEALANTVFLCRIKYGNLDPEIDVALTKYEAILAKLGKV